MDAVLLPAALAGCLAAVHLVADRVPLETSPRSRWLSAAGGVAVAYVFVHLLPDVGEAARTVVETVAVPVTLLERHVYLLALAGFVAFYGLERYAAVPQNGGGAAGRTRAAGGGVSGRTGIDERGDERVRFRVHVGSFAAYNGLIGYLLVDAEGSAAGLVLYAVAMGLHMLGNDYALRAQYELAYHRTGRWLLAGAVLAGAAVGLLLEIHEAAVALLLAFLAGGIVLNVIKEELPEERESRFGAFAVGAGGYAVLLLVV